MNLTINSEYMKNNVKMKMQTPSYFLRVSTIISLLIIFNVTICLAQNPKLETIDSGGFLTSHWTQDYPYNQLCPRDPVNNYSYSYAGCPAVAMGQILNFLRTTQETRFSDSDDYSHNYAGRNYNIDDDWESLQFPSFPQLNELLDSIDVSFQRGERLNDIQAAALIFACGTACTQVYTSEGSGTFAVSQAYEAYQRFGFSECTLFYDADSTMFATLISNLQEGYPAHLAVENPEGTIGHNVVVDGYREEDGKFHMDFGYGGALDGWYDIPDPNFYYGMTKMEGIILNIIPTNTPSSINEKSPEKSLVVYPNPTSDLINIENFSDKTTAYSIFNVTGQEIKTGFTSGKISVSELEKGIYFLQIKDEKLYKMIKFVKK
ncbi:MAG: T9SS type A sorting domain-containing protein [Lentimicrobiaceae bacterium]|nr:T9SS type A sorting domain-containing protein [Lentimicrobiaceae bacterium]